jgi:hypothetical protein
MDPSRLQTLVTVAYPALFGAVLIMISIVGCRLHTHHHRLTSLEFRAYTLEAGPRIPIASPVLQSRSRAQSQSQPSAPPMLDPIPPPPDHYALSMPTATVVAQMRHYNGYI